MTESVHLLLTVVDIGNISNIRRFVGHLVF